MDRTLLLALILFTAAAIAETDHNLTFRQPSWSTAEESDLLPPDASVSDADGGFSSMDSMLHWAISMHNLNNHCHKNYFNFYLFLCVLLGHSDPEKLKESAQVHEGLSPSELQKRQLEIKVM